VAPVPPPVTGVAVDVLPVRGTVLVNGVLLTAGQQIPVGSVVNTLDGTVRLQTVLPNGTIQQMDFAGGIFKILQLPGGTTQLVLQGGNFSVCGAQKKGVRKAAAAAAKATVRILWGNGQGNFQTKGRYAAATVRGTIYYVADRCDGTFTHVSRGVVAVNDLTLGKTITIRAGQSYLAKP
jgi:hypothetical protein